MSHTEIKAELYFASSYSMNISSRDQRAKQNSIQVEEERRSVTSRYHGSKFLGHIYNNKEFLQRRRRAAKKKKV